MTVQELINELNKVEDKSKPVYQQTMERKIDEIFEVEGITLQAIETEDMHCKNCYFNFNKNCNDILCLPSERIDKKNIIFREVNKMTPQRSILRYVICVIKLGLLIQIGIGRIQSIIMSYVGNLYQIYQKNKK